MNYSIDREKIERLLKVLQPAKVLVLFAIAKGASTFKEISKVSGVTDGGVNLALTVLTAEGYVEKHKRTYNLTPKGKRLIALLKEYLDDTK